MAWVVGAWPAWGKEEPDLTDSGIRDKFTPGLLDSRFRRRRGPGTCTPGFWKRGTLSTCSTVNISCLTAAKNAPADKDATKPAPKEALPQEARAEPPKGEMVFQRAGQKLAPYPPASAGPSVPSRSLSFSPPSPQLQC